jgi:hypothetical protein
MHNAAMLTGGMDLELRHVQHSSSVGPSARSDQVESPGRKELAQVQWLEHDLAAKVVSTFADHALGACLDNLIFVASVHWV